MTLTPQSIRAKLRFLCRAFRVSRTCSLRRGERQEAARRHPLVPSGREGFCLPNFATTDPEPKPPNRTTTQRGNPMDRVLIFDTTLRDGEQSPGIALDVGEKLEIADQLARLGVDVIEAGCPIASDGDFEAVEAIATAVHGPTIAALSRTGFKDVD